MQNISLVAGKPGRLPRKSSVRPHLTLIKGAKAVPPNGLYCSTGRPAGMIMRGGDWKIETVDLENVSGNQEQGEGELNGKVVADANGLWLLVTRYPGRVFYVRTIPEAQDIVASLGGDWSDLTVTSRWIFSGPTQEDGSW